MITATVSVSRARDGRSLVFDLVLFKCGAWSQGAARETQEWETELTTTVIYHRRNEKDYLKFRFCAWNGWPSEVTSDIVDNSMTLLQM